MTLESPTIAVLGEIREVTATDEDAGQRLDRVLAARLPDLSRSRLKAMILAGDVSVSGGTIRDPERRVNAGDALVVQVPAPVSAVPEGEPIALNVVYEDSDLIVIDKP